MTFRLDRDGAERFCSALREPEVTAVGRLFPPNPRPGNRLTGDELAPIADLLGGFGSIGSIAQRCGGSAMRPVRALLLDKSPQANWNLTWHQDRVIAVRERVELPGFTGWSNKDGLLHVQPPGALMQRMLTLRVHVDRVSEENAPLRILRGSHLFGSVRESEVGELARSLEQVICLAEPGDVWLYRTSVIHASDPQRIMGRRRVLQLDYADFDLPGGLSWAYANLY